jgi:acyl carrier protein phosphodiesterase
MDNRFAMKSNMNEAVEDLYQHYDDFQREFHLFFKDLMIHANAEKVRLEQEFKK